MFFTLSNEMGDPIDVKKQEIQKFAYDRIQHTPMLSTELQLNDYLLKNIKKDLKTTCKELIAKKLKISAGAENNTLVVTFIDSQSDKLASLITYGNSEIKGSTILQNAFDQPY